MPVGGTAEWLYRFDRAREPDASRRQEVSASICRCDLPWGRSDQRPVLYRLDLAVPFSYLQMRLPPSPGWRTRISDSRNRTVKKVTA